MLATLKNTTIRMIAAVAIPAALGLTLTAHSLAAVHMQDNHTVCDGPGGSGYPSSTLAGPGNSTPYLADDDGPGNDGNVTLADDDGPGLGGGYACSADGGALYALDGPGGSAGYLF